MKLIEKDLVSNNGQTSLTHARIACGSSLLLTYQFSPQSQGPPPKVAVGTNNCLVAVASGLEE